MDKHTPSNTATSCSPGRVRGAWENPQDCEQAWPLGSGRTPQAQNQGLLFARALSWFDVLTTMQYCFSSETWKSMHAQSLPSCPALCDPVDCNLPGFSVHGILQARILERVAMPSSRVSS